MALFGLFESKSERGARLDAVAQSASEAFDFNTIRMVAAWVDGRGPSNATSQDVWAAASQLTKAFNGEGKLGPHLAGKYAVELSQWWWQRGIFEHLDENRPASA